MQSKSEPTKITDKTSSLKEQQGSFAQNIANSTFVAATTSVVIVLISGPLRTATMFAASGTPIPFSLSFARTSYNGTSAALSSSAARTTYVTTIKSNKPVTEEAFSEGLFREETLLEENNASSAFKLKYGYYVYPLGAAAGETIITQAPETLSSLKKLPQPPIFSWKTPHNLLALMGNGTSIRFLASAVNFGAMLNLEKSFASVLPIPNETTKDLISSAICGAAAAVLSYPLTSFRDRLITETTATNGKLVNPSTYGTIKALTQHCVQNPKQVANEIAQNAKRQLPFRTLHSAAIFTAITATARVLGQTGHITGLFDKKS